MTLFTKAEYNVRIAKFNMYRQFRTRSFEICERTDKTDTDCNNSRRSLDELTRTVNLSTHERRRKRLSDDASSVAASVAAAASALVWAAETRQGRPADITSAPGTTGHMSYQ